MQNVVKCPDIPQKSCGVHTARFLKYLRPFYNIMHERAKCHLHKIPIFKPYLKSQILEGTPHRDYFLELV